MDSLALLCPGKQDNSDYEVKHGLSMPNSERKSKRTVISIEEYQPQLDFEEAEHSPSFTFPEYQRELIGSRVAAGFTDFGLVALVFVIFLATTILEMPDNSSLDKRVLGIYGVCYFALVTIYFFLFMLSASQTPGMKYRGLTVVTRDGQPLDPKRACMRGFGYLISILPVLLGFLWMLIDPEHLTWADKVSGTYIKRL
jgi:uncharacterized RDD family membrane protein YckC